eukprot:6186198-Pleurochrysis_carterae.AAC.3
MPPQPPQLKSKLAALYFRMQRVYVQLRMQRPRSSRHAFAAPSKEAKRNNYSPHYSAFMIYGKL